MNRATPPLPDILAGNVWPNPAFEDGEKLDDPANATMAYWSRGGSDVSICVVSHTGALSPAHALALEDNNPDGYGEWYQSLDLAGKATPGETVEALWWEMFNVSDGGEMRRSLVFLNAAGATIGAQHYVTRGQSSGWIDDPAHSFITQRNERFVLPANTTRLLVTLASGGSLAVTGTMMIDDFSIRVATFDFHLTALEADGGGWRLIWESTPGAVYSVESTPTLTPPAFATIPGLDWVIASDAATTTAADARTNLGPIQFYRVLRMQ